MAKTVTTKKSTRRKVSKNIENGKAQLQYQMFKVMLYLGQVLED